MTPIRSILAATDFSVDGTNAVCRAALLAQRHGARLSLLHVVDPAGFGPLRGWFSRSTDIDLKTSQARSTLRQFAAEVIGRYDVMATFEVRVGDALEELLRASERADLVVLGQRGKNPLKDLVIGKTADRLLRTCRTPVLVVKQSVEGPYRRVLVPVDLTPCSDAAVRVAATLAPELGIRVFHAVDSTPDAMLRRADVPEAVIRRSKERQDAGISARIRRGVAKLGLDSRRMSFVLARGPAVRLTLLQAQELRADLIVAGRQGHSTMARFLLGSVSSRLLAESSCDMLVVPRPVDLPIPSRVLAQVRSSRRDTPIDTAGLARGAAALAAAMTNAQVPAAATRALDRRTV